MSEGQAENLAFIVLFADCRVVISVFGFCFRINRSESVVKGQYAGCAAFGQPLKKLCGKPFLLSGSECPDIDVNKIFKENDSDFDIIQDQGKFGEIELTEVIYSFG